MTVTANILQSLLTIQAARQYVPVEAISHVAQALGVTEADVAGVLTYYPDLRTAPPPSRHVIRVCTGESCLANRCEAVLQAVKEYISLNSGDRTTETPFSVEKIYCMGNCALSPTIVVDRDIHGRVEPDQVSALLERYR